MKYDILITKVGKLRGHFTSKENRVAKLIESWDDLQEKFESMIVRGSGSTDTARLAYATLMMMETGIRVGNEGSAEGFVCINQKVAGKDYPDRGIKKGDVIWRHPMYGQTIKTYGLTTLLHRHVKKRGKELRINFVGKKIVEQNLRVNHPLLVKFKPEGDRHDSFLDVDYNSFKKFIKKYVGKGYSPKDLRTAKVNMIFLEMFSKKPYHPDYDLLTTKSARKQLLGACIEATANVIGHTKGVCKASYLSPSLIRYIVETPNQ
jgi:DNA topoisomerase IB